MLVNLPKIAKKTWHYLNKPVFGASSYGGVSNLRNPAPWLLDNLLGNQLSKSGASVDEYSALNLTPWWGAIRNISEDIAKLPMNILERNEQDQKKNVNMKFPEIFDLLDRRANKYVSSMSFYETWINHALSYGNGYGEIVRDRSGRPRALNIIHPSRVKLFFRKNQLFYEVSTQTTIAGQEYKHVVLPAKNVLHLHGLGGDGLVGYSLFYLGREALGITISAQAYSATYYSNGTSLTGVLEMPGSLDKESQERLRESWSRLHNGNACNSHGIAILEGDTKFKPISDSAQASQLIETRKFQVLEMCRLLRMPPHKVASLESAIRANVENQDTEYFRDTLMPWIKRISKEISYKFWPDDPQRFAIHEVNALTLGDTKTRMEVFKGYRNMGVLSANEVRGFENLNVANAEGMDDYNMQSNITTIDRISEGENLKDQNRQVSDSEGGEEPTNGTEATFKTVIVEKDNKMIFENARENNMPTFKQAARRIVEKESKAVKRHIEDRKHDLAAFKKWAKTFFVTQRMDIIENFGPAVMVFINTCDDLSFKDNYAFLPEYAASYSEDGYRKAVLSFEDGVYDDIDRESNIEKLAESVIHQIGLQLEVSK